MVRVTTDKKIYIKILVWGITGSGKTEYLEILYRMAKEENIDIVSIDNLIKLSMDSGSTLYFDRGLYQSKKNRDIYFHIYTVAGQSRFSPLRKKIFKGTDGIIFIADANTGKVKDNIESLQELKSISKGQLIKTIPLIVLLNKKDSEDCITKEAFIKILRDEDLWNDSTHELSQWNPKIIDTNLSYEQRIKLYECFSECARRLVIYQTYGNGAAPTTEIFQIQKNNFESVAQMSQEGLLKLVFEKVSKSTEVNYENQNILEIVQQTMKVSGEFLSSAWDLLNKAQLAYSSGNLEEARDHALESKVIFIDLKSKQGIKKVEGLLMDIETGVLNTIKILSNNKKKIHIIMFNGELERCLLHDELNAKCIKIEEIKKTIEEPKIFGFFMYQFPKREEQLEYDFLKKENERYLKEIQKLKILINNINNDPLLQIDFPTEATTLSIKTCDFCRIARSYDFGILLLSPSNPNTFLEAGMFLSLGKKLVLLNNESLLKTTPYDLSPYVYI